MIPLYSLTGSGNIAFQYLMGHLTCNTSRAYYQTLMIFLQILTISTRTHIVAVDPRVADQFNQVLVALVVLSQYNKVVTALVLLVTFQQFRAIARHIHLATENRYKGFQSFFLSSFVDTYYIVVKLFDAKHVAVIGNGHTSHAISHRLVDKPFDARLSIKNRVICMYMKMYEIFHKMCCFCLF